MEINKNNKTNIDIFRTWEPATTTLYMITCAKRQEVLGLEDGTNYLSATLINRFFFGGKQYENNETQIKKFHKENCELYETGKENGGKFGEHVYKEVFHFYHIEKKDKVDKIIWETGGINGKFADYNKYMTCPICKLEISEEQFNELPNNHIIAHQNCYQEKGDKHNCSSPRKSTDQSYEDYKDSMPEVKIGKIMKGDKNLTPNDFNNNERN